MGDDCGDLLRGAAQQPRLRAAVDDEINRLKVFTAVVVIPDFIYKMVAPAKKGSVAGGKLSFQPQCFITGVYVTANVYHFVQLLQKRVSVVTVNAVGIV